MLKQRFIHLCSKTNITQLSSLYRHNTIYTTIIRYKSCGIVGLPNVGKSTLFNALTNQQLAQSSNYPFTTIQPNKAFVSIIDNRLQQLANIAQSDKIVTPQIEFIDIAGLIKDAHSGAGLGNLFLSNVRSVDIILHMIRCYDNNDIIHVDSSIDPLRDIQTIETELLLSDIQLLEKRLVKHTNKNTNNDMTQLIHNCIDILNNGKWLVDYIQSLSYNQKLLIQQLNLITAKRVCYVCNVDDNSAKDGNHYSQQVKQFIDQLYNNDIQQQHDNTNDNNSNKLQYKPQQRPVIHIATQLEADAIELNDDATMKQEYLTSNNVIQTSLEKVVSASSSLLQQQVFYTIGPEQSVSWSIDTGSTALQAADKIHTDIARGFINADIISYNDYIQYNGEAGCRSAGVINIVGKDYIMKDGDIINIRFNKQAAAKK